MLQKAVIALALSLSTTAVASPTVQEHWLAHFSDAELVNRADRADASGPFTVENKYLFCRQPGVSGGTFTHLRLRVNGGLPPLDQTIIPDPNPLLPVGQWRINVIDGGFGVHTAQLVLSSANGVIKQFSLGYANNATFIEGATFARYKLPVPAVCPAVGNDYGVESPLK
jgi:hypothetical protein